ncbi:ATP-binding protein [Actinacidiphila yeochonensis]|uniref:ATP-binding protein n=1 Tax=Actinacidiphila yeochonensis TaxID=89050 RepID=UPI000568E2CE|nr:ATP-binding protein [Actinacidiphila yeochonensis]
MRTPPPAASNAPETGRPEVVSRWPRTRRTVGRAREDLRVALAKWGLEELADAAELVLSELVTNSVRHARTPAGRLVETRYTQYGRGLRIEVHDADETWPRPRAAMDEDEGGRGLALVDALTQHRWGVEPRPGPGKLVWAHIGDLNEVAPDGPVDA